MQDLLNSLRYFELIRIYFIGLFVTKGLLLYLIFFYLWEANQSNFDQNFKGVFSNDSLIISFITKVENSFRFAFSKGFS